MYVRGIVEKVKFTNPTPKSFVVNQASFPAEHNTNNNTNNNTTTTNNLTINNRDKTFLKNVIKY